ncbi:hypothetical protein, partial [Janthinobacterium sp. UMAB-56]|uniref:hypothetical protein n=1 Tax=Janthinobacterium sp. UMAB-56 TaxID=1365361 RepID=UPI001C5990E0
CNQCESRLSSGLLFAVEKNPASNGGVFFRLLVFLLFTPYEGWGQTLNTVNAKVIANARR